MKRISQTKLGTRVNSVSVFDHCSNLTHGEYSISYPAAYLPNWHLLSKFNSNRVTYCNCY
jgi:hypothetical protein